jgi:hypothetical protein
MNKWAVGTPPNWHHEMSKALDMLVEAAQEEGVMQKFYGKNYMGDKNAVRRNARKKVDVLVAQAIDRGMK